MIFLDAAMGKKTDRAPVWFMRQAGRYLSEYREVRASCADFLALCRDPQKAAAVTLQPVEILGVDAAILFSDILVLPLELGMDLSFISGVGPKFAAPIKEESDLLKLQKNAAQKLNYVYETIKIVRNDLPQDKALIGFCGAPWTLATYMIEGGGSKSYEKCKKILYQNPRFLHNLLDLLAQNLAQYLVNQIKAGADCVMIFDSWASALEPSAYLEFGYKYIAQIAQELKAQYPQIPIIAFPKGVGGFLDEIVDFGANVNVLGIDWGIKINKAKEQIAERYAIQGNLEPARLYDLNSAKDGAREILESMKTYNGGFIFNLGHGMIPDLPRENAIELVKFIQNFKF